MKLELLKTREVLEEQRKKMKQWNKTRAICESNGIARFWALKEMFRNQKINPLNQ